MRTLPCGWVDGLPPPVDACSLSSLQDEVHALPGGWAHSSFLGTLPRVVPVFSAPSEMRCSQSPERVVGWRADWSCCCRGIPQSAPEIFFLFGKNPPAGSCGSLLRRKGLTFTQPTLQLGCGLSGSGFQVAPLSTLLSQFLRSPWVFHFGLIPLPATLGNQACHSVAQALFGS